MEKKGLIFFGVLLILSIGNYARLTGNENVRLIQFISIFTIGAFASLLIAALVRLFKVKKDNNQPKLDNKTTDINKEVEIISQQIHNGKKQ